MGLDMYLSKRTYVKRWDYQTPERKHEVIVLRGGKPREDIDINKISDVIEEVMYWRKANAIHSWFVKNVQDGVDDCREYWVSEDQLQELIDLCSKSCETKDIALLPPQTGFFFGSQETDDWYWEELSNTAKTLTEVLDHHRNTNSSGEFYYQSSW